MDIQIRLYTIFCVVTQLHNTAPSEETVKFNLKMSVVIIAMLNIITNNCATMIYL